MPADIKALQLKAHGPHRGLYLVGPGQLDFHEEALPQALLSGETILTASLGNCRCSSDNKAIKLFDKHARVPSGVKRIALGHESIQLVLSAPADCDVGPGDLVVVTPGFSAEPIDPDSFEPKADGVLAAFGYSYATLGGLRQFNAFPKKAIEVVARQGFGKLFNRVTNHSNVSLCTLAHAEPFACCYGAIKHVITSRPDGSLGYGIPPRAHVAYLGGTSRMAMINLTIVSTLPKAELPRRVSITGSPRKLDALEHCALLAKLRSRGVEVAMFDRGRPDIVEALLSGGKAEVVFTNYPSQEVYRQAVAIVARGGNINNYAGATDPDIGFSMLLDAAPAFGSPGEQARQRIAWHHHALTLGNPKRSFGLRPGGRVALLGFDRERLSAYLQTLPAGLSVHLETEFKNLLAARSDLNPLETFEAFDDVLIAGSGDAARRHYESVEPQLRRDAAVSFVDGNCEIHLRSKAIHYATRHQICGPEAPWLMANTSEPQSADMAIQADHPVDFDWMVAGVAGLAHAAEMLGDVMKTEPFGSFFTLVQLEDFPYIAVSAAAFRAKAAELKKSGARQPLLDALRKGAEVLDANGGVWSRALEETLHQALGINYPLAD